MATITNQPIPHNPLTGQRPEINIPLHDGSDEQISIVIVHKDRPEYLNLCLQSITVCSFNNNYEIIVVDNGKITVKLPPTYVIFAILNDPLIWQILFILVISHTKPVPAVP